MNTTKIMQHLIGVKYQDLINNLSVNEDYGDCCGYANIEVEDFVKEINDNENAVLKDIVKIEYDSIYDEDRVVVNFIFDIGELKGIILGYELTAGSGSGWNYGAYCTLLYKEEEVALASW